MKRPPVPTWALVRSRTYCSSVSSVSVVALLSPRLGFHGTLNNVLQEDPEWAAKRIQHPESVFLPFHRLRPLVQNEGRSLCWMPRSKVAPLLASSQPVLLGLSKVEGSHGGEVAHFAINVADTEWETSDQRFIEPRVAVSFLPQDQAGIVAQARSLLDWNARHTYCPNCGSTTEPKDGGRSRRCTRATCGSQHFPRVDPVVISLVRSFDGTRCLLGRKREWKQGMWSALAGFMEPGETMEDAVRREVYEEAGVRVGEVTYLKSQPWPFPSSLMLGCMARAASEDGQGIKVDPHEMEDVRWFARGEVEAMLRNASNNIGRTRPEQEGQNQTGVDKDGQTPTVVMAVPGQEAIAHHLIWQFVVSEAGC